MGSTIYLCKNCFSSIFIFSDYNVRYILFTLFITPFIVWEFQSNPIEHMNLYVVLGVLYLGIVSTAGAFFLWNKGLELMDASIGSLFFFFQPIVGSFLGWLLLNETLNSNFLLVVFLLYVVFLLLLLKRMKNRQRYLISACSYNWVLIVKTNTNRYIPLHFTTRTHKTTYRSSN